MPPLLDWADDITPICGNFGFGGCVVFAACRILTASVNSLHRERVTVTLHCDRYADKLQAMSKTTGMAKLRKSSVVFVVDDIAATIPWYESLGFQAEAFPSSPPHAFCILERDEVVIMLQQ